MIAALDKAASGTRLGEQEALALLDPAVPLVELGASADAVRRRLHPAPVVTYVIDRNINYTNVCVSGCAFCAFHRPEGSPEAYVLSRGELHAKVAELVAAGGTQILMQGGLHPTLPLAWHEELLRDLKRAFPKTAAGAPIHLHCFSPPEIVHFARLAQKSVREVLERLAAAGLDTLPGGGAEILAERVRRKVSPRKCTAAEWLGVLRDWAALGKKGSATMMFNHAETLPERIEHLARLRELQEETGGVFTSFTCWTYQRAARARAHPADAAIYLRMQAVARLFLDNIPHVQTSWVTQGTRVAQVALRFGADDLSGTLMEEHVVAAAGTRVVAEVPREELHALVEELGDKLVQRDYFYRPVVD